MEPVTEERTVQPTPLDLVLANTWPVAMFVGVVSIAIGVIVMAWPGGTLTVLSVLFGIQLLLFGLFRLISSFSQATEFRGLSGFIGVIGLISGVVVIRNPFETVTALAVILGLMWVVGGAVELVSALGDSTIADRWFVALSGLFSVIAGVVVLAWPGPTVSVIAWVAGIWLVVLGVMVCIGAFRMRRLERDAAIPTGAA